MGYFEQCLNVFINTLNTVIVWRFFRLKIPVFAFNSKKDCHAGFEMT